MGEVLITFDRESIAEINDEINIKAIVEEEGIEYKFLEGVDALWNPIQDFSSSNICKWRPKEEGKYIIMVQAKREKSKKSFDFLGKRDYEVNIKKGKEILEDIILDKNSLMVGEKINIEVKTKEDVALYRFWIGGKQGWELLRDYTTENTLTYTACNPGEQEVLVECKMPESENNVDEFKTLKFNVSEIVKVEIVDFKCLTENLLVGEEILFKVISNCDDSRTLLYKFLKVDKNGRVKCVQDYSTRNIISFTEKEQGEYKLLCLVRDIFSNKEYDDRAIMLYEIRPYNEIMIKNFSSDIISPQISGTKINFKAIVEGGKQKVYRYIIEGPIAEDTGYIRREEFEWETKAEGEYKITLQVKDLSYDGEYEDKKTITYNVEKKADKPVKIVDIISTKTRNCVIGEPVNIKVKAEGGTAIRYSFLVFKDGVEKERSDYGSSNWVNFTPEEHGEYEVEIRVLDKYSSKEYDSHSFLYLRVREYMPAEIDYVLLSPKETYLVGDNVELETIVQNTKSVLLRYVTKINGHEVEDTGYVNTKRLKIKPKCPGKYTFSIYAKNVKCKEEYDSKKEISLYVHEATPVTNTKIKLISEEVKVNKEVAFEITSEGGKEVCYEVYIMERGNWVRTQEYSRKNYYTFIPFSMGKYRLMVLSKSYYRNSTYEDYDSIEFDVEC
ncbi:triple tyrosine motif-containing protein [Clostridium chauvoei]|uniref:Triple tyrosine motif-containing protein n=2 Tax=Clostridium chauvoei TaxID=46867 RepID=A0ABD4RIJ9_9CLOT|nr:triple tyrosine motif-containing protein [Clostridium chauvoei]ATD55989.1 triple tyrosine motif-containing protein [Clostridium chauvoei]ATD56342.1 triple tyrosine motif-containing protein [Clostridium chauvoei]MBX7280887.1 triple tyrosine motif-containing protein [Clostridium chauvoei]MBX7283370.1 triple tyrosine motif-containing protein [Clostridium chauvoei]MBX7285947.1 triple tyrosine motif-containing protein [Clostridium chauvoei]